ncbi:MAG: minor capsid protein [Fimbriimonadales bacterium]
MAIAFDDPRTIALDVPAVERFLDEAEARFGRAIHRAILRMLSGWTEEDIETGRFDVPPVVLIAVTTAFRILSNATEQYGRERAWIEAGGAQSFAVIASAGTGPFARMAADWLDAIPDKAAEIVADHLHEGARGQMKALMQEFPTWSRLRAERMARSVAAYMFNRGRITEFAKNKAIVGLEYTAIMDTRVCEICYPLDGLVLPIDALTAAPYPLFGIIPPLHWQCRCTFMPLLSLVGKPVVQSRWDLWKAANHGMLGIREGVGLPGKAYTGPAPGGQ